MNWRIVAIATFALGQAGLALAESSEGHGSHGWDTTALTASFVNFFLLMALFVYLFRSKMNEFLKARRASVENALNEAAKLKADAEAKHREYTDRLARLDDELEQIRKEMLAAGAKERDRIVAEAEHKAARMRREAEFMIEQHAKQLRADVSRETAETAVRLAEELLLKATTQYDHQRLAQEYLAHVAKRPSLRPSRAPDMPAESQV